MLYHSVLILNVNSVDKLSDIPFNENFLTRVPIIYMYIYLYIYLYIDVLSMCVRQMWVLGMGYGEVWILTSHNVNLIFSCMYLDVGVISN